MSSHHPCDICIEVLGVNALHLILPLPWSLILGVVSHFDGESKLLTKDLPRWLSSVCVCVCFFSGSTFLKQWVRTEPGTAFKMRLYQGTARKKPKFVEFGVPNLIVCNYHARRSFTLIFAHLRSLAHLRLRSFGQICALCSHLRVSVLCIDKRNYFLEPEGTQCKMLATAIFHCGSH